MKRNWMAAALLPVLFTLQGCVVVIGHGTEDGVYLGSSSKEEGGVQHDGDKLSREVARALAADGDLVAQDIRVSSEDGLVVLKGRVQGVAMLERALASARGVAGVERVVSKMAVEAD